MKKKFKPMMRLIDAVVSDLAAGRPRSGWSVYHRDLEVLLETGYVVYGVGKDLRLTPTGRAYATGLA